MQKKANNKGLFTLLKLVSLVVQIVPFIIFGDRQEVVEITNLLVWGSALSVLLVSGGVTEVFVSKEDCFISISIIPLILVTYFLVDSGIISCESVGVLIYLIYAPFFMNYYLAESNFIIAGLFASKTPFLAVLFGGATYVLLNVLVAIFIVLFLLKRIRLEIRHKLTFRFRKNVTSLLASAVNYLNQNIEGLFVVSSFENYNSIGIWMISSRALRLVHFVISTYYQLVVQEMSKIKDRIMRFSLWKSSVIKGNLVAVVGSIILIVSLKILKYFNYAIDPEIESGLLLLCIVLWAQASTGVSGYMLVFQNNRKDLLTSVIISGLVMIVCLTIQEGLSIVSVLFIQVIAVLSQNGYQLVRVLDANR